MPLSSPSDDKIEALVGLVLQAVDQRLSVVREQLADLTNTVARNHADLQTQIETCRELITVGGAHADVGTGGAGDAAASAQLVRAANVLTERVTFLEERVNGYTNDRVAELRATIEQLMVSASRGPSGSVAAVTTGSTSITPAPPNVPGSLSPAVEKLGPLRTRAFADISQPVAVTPAPSREPNSQQTPVTLAPMTVAAFGEPATAAKLEAAATATTPDVAVKPDHVPTPEFDIDAFSAQLNARLSALVERAISN